tara:strand:+ start:3152 stop:3427 length:276 start_codon:yes stop_codon:yes gene_type:complete
MGRVVLTHSTFIEGLVPLLKKLSNNAQIKTIIPGRICRVRSNSENLNLRISVAIKGGFKIIARRGKSAQEVFITTTLKKESLKELIEINKT